MNINKIAELAGVSRATVSRYLNQGYVSEEKKRRIRQVIEETGYKPSAQAQMLRTRQTKLVGVILPKISSSSISRMVAGISDIMKKEGYQIILANTNNDIKEELEYLTLFKSNRVDGIIFIATIFIRKHMEILSDYQIPVVILGQCLKGYSCVYQDECHAAQSLTQILLRNGKKIGYIGVTTKDRAAGAERKRGFEKAIKETGMICPQKYRRQASFEMSDGYEIAKELLIENPELDSLFCATDTLALGAMQYAKQHGIAIPEKLQIVGIGDPPMGEVIEPALTTIHFYYKTSGEEAGKLLTSMLKSGDIIRKEIKMGFEICERKSTR